MRPHHLLVPNVPPFSPQNQMAKVSAISMNVSQKQWQRRGVGLRVNGGVRSSTSLVARTYGSNRRIGRHACTATMTTAGRMWWAEMTGRMLWIMLWMANTGHFLSTLNRNTKGAILQ